MGNVAQLVIVLVIVLPLYEVVEGVVVVTADFVDEAGEVVLFPKVVVLDLDVEEDAVVVPIV